MALLFDFQAFQGLLLQAARTSFSAMQADHPDEAFYTFAFFTRSDYGAVLPTGNTEQGLARTLDMYRLDYAVHNLPFEAETVGVELRWEMTIEWAQHRYAQQAFERVNTYLAEFSTGKDQLDEAEQAVFESGVAGAMWEVLHLLDGEGLFGHGPAREQVIVNVLLGDEAVLPRLRKAQALNPPPAFERYRADLESLYGVLNF